MAMIKNYTIKTTLLILVVTLLAACGSDGPKFTHFKAFDERFTTVIDTSEPAKLKTLAELFYDQQIATGTQENFDFVYLIDVTTKEGSTRYRCTKTGYCQLRTEGVEMQKEIIFLENFRDLYDQANLNSAG